MHTEIKILGICGSLRNKSLTRLALNSALKGAEQAGAVAELVDLRQYNLVFCNGGDNYPDDVHKLRKLVKQSHGVILATPEYHGSYSGVLKNALDLMGFDEFEGKMMGLIGLSAGALGGNDAINTLRTVGRSLHAWVVPEQVSIAFADKAFDENGIIKEKSLETRLVNLGLQVARFSYLHSSTHAKEFIKAWEEAPSNPGAKHAE